MAKLHELLAVEGDLKGEKDKIAEETKTVFEKKTEHFIAKVRRLEMFDDGRKQEEEEEKKALTTTVYDKLQYMSKSFSRFWDAKLQKESANQEAKSDIVIDGKTIAKDVPVTFLLHMEDELKNLRKIYDSIPTLQPGINWILDDQMGDHVYKTSDPIVKMKTEKTIEYRVVVQPTDHHPAQIKEISIDKNIGKYIETFWSGMLTPAEKSILLSKVDLVLRAVKKARQRANGQEVKDLQIGKVIFDYIHS